MRTYKKTTDAPRLVIKYDTDVESPRMWEGNIGYFLTKENRYNSPDGTDNPLYQIMIDTQYQAANNADEHMELIKKEAEEQGIRITDIYPVYRYEHGNVVYRRGIAQGFDYSNCGFYIVTTKTIEGRTETTESIQKTIDDELETYTKYANGEVYYYILYNEQGEIEGSCGGFYSIDDIKEHLPDDWKDEELSEYLQF